MTNNIDPKLIIEVQGKNKITDYYKTFQFEVDEKLEATIKLNADSGDKSIYLDTVYPIRMLIIESPELDDSSDDYTNTLIITTLGLGVASGTETDQIIEFHGFNILRFPQSFGERITDVKLNTTSVDEISISLKAYSKTIV